MSIELLTSAAVFAAQAHVNQRRKELNEPYINHPLRVGKLYAELVESADVEAIAAGYMHDVPEDTDIPQATIDRLFPERTALFVNVLTKWWKKATPTEEHKYKDLYYGRIIDAGAMDLKFADRIDNIGDFLKVVRLAPTKHSWARKYLQKSEEEFVPRLFHASPRVQTEFTVALNALRLALG
jgi:(p)ppGpp synthase/HD superfamily hydrolase